MAKKRTSRNPKRGSRAGVASRAEVVAYRAQGTRRRVERAIRSGDQRAMDAAMWEARSEFDAQYAAAPTDAEAERVEHAYSWLSGLRGGMRANGTPKRGSRRLRPNRWWGSEPSGEPLTFDLIMQKVGNPAPRRYTRAEYVSHLMAHAVSSLATAESRVEEATAERKRTGKFLIPREAVAFDLEQNALNWVASAFREYGEAAALARLSPHIKLPQDRDFNDKLKGPRRCMAASHEASLVNA